MEIRTPYASATGKLLHRNGSLNQLFCREVLFSTDPHWKYLDMSIYVAD